MGRFIMKLLTEVEGAENWSVGATFLSRSPVQPGNENQLRVFRPAARQECRAYWSPFR
jgi:hypothetical protein